MFQAVCRWLSAAVLVASGAAAGAAAPSVGFATEGGAAWTFDKPLEGHYRGCDSVWVRGPEGEVRAWRDQGRFRVDLPLQEGTNRVQALCRRDGEVVGRSPVRQWTVLLDDAPQALIRARVADDGTVLLEAGGSAPAAGVPAPLAGFRWSAAAHNPAPLYPVDAQVPLAQRPARGEQLRLRPPPADGEYYVSVTVTDALGRDTRSTGVFRVEQGAAQAVDLEREHPAWVDRAVLYGVAPYFFGEGNLAGVSERLDEIAQLGATAVWLSPITDAPPDDFGYAPANHFALRERFGSEAEFRAFVERAHALGLKVIMDFVPNHFGDQHPYYRHAERLGPRSPYYDWFERGPDGETETYFDWENLKNLNYDNPEVQNYIIAAFAQWVRDYGVDGFRVDASWAIRQRAPEFWERWRTALKRIDPDLFLLAEASARDPYYIRHGFDAAYDWTAELGEWAWEGVFQADGPEADLAALRAALTNRGEGFAEDSLILRFINNNDTGERFVSRYGPGMTRVASALLFTLPGIPLIYNGDEVGAELEPYQEGPPIVWRDRHGLLPHYTRLAELRRERPALWSDQLRLLETDRDAVVLAYLRPGTPPARDVLVALNFSDEPVSVRLRRQPELDRLLEGEPLQRLMGQGRVELDPQRPRLDLPPYGVRVLLGAPAR